MNKIINYEDLVRELTNDLNYHKYFLELLEKVEIKRKKDGTHFANKNQTFVNGKVIIKSYNDSNHPSFEVSGICSDGKYRNYDFDAYLYIDDMRRKNPDDIRIQGIENSSGYLRNTYLLTTDEIIERIEKEKKRQKEYIANYEKQINASKEIFDEIAEKLDVLKNTIYENCKDLRENPIFRCSLEYALADYVISNIK
jgi:hypothetical protein